ncbi:hypothetical protein Aasi_1675 [Candidatus Amoebophilus asiaticus 5a2]|uniref:Uncharacterized protein n=1 Tax=Amoebophilus asiaticus (strain 5a2) TaxID=452471 RepID=C3L3T3_AMOA5|nr:hypothetical protein Aasi_1675 [Candidatus Amoebophilus asiaticus 5a2]
MHSSGTVSASDMLYGYAKTNLLVKSAHFAELVKYINLLKILFNFK